MGGMASGGGLGGLSKESYPVFTRVSEKITENSERLDGQARPGIEPGPSRLTNFENRPTRLLMGQVFL